MARRVERPPTSSSAASRKPWHRRSLPRAPSMMRKRSRCSSRMNNDSLGTGPLASDGDTIAMAMTTQLDGSHETVDFDFLLGDREVRFDIDESLYMLDAIYGAAYVFVDRCYIFLARPKDRKVTVRLRTRELADMAQLEQLAG